ncbi:glycoside hydrolase superfamily [Annulohypoxylon maeteangense]|uniref:glycoside hydrolase superfamily n=1 Tax=Annulohypoxylon maeteangense TaxID=1927788 RepID=UPI0020076F43|nr:glycoside hydrolase superfamily [Annulohypoxylon maeteangense]KAI0884191.1 glycoside hydrolase superfamily [Annulohypoxylon maeteangense]
MDISSIPHLVKTENSWQLIVHGKPFLMLPAELQNSSFTSHEYMSTVWQKLVDSNVNTVLGCVTWEMIEPIEGRFEFSELDKIIQGAREHELHVVLLWFGSFKNGLSTYVPPWVKTNPKRFPRAKLRKAGGILETADVLSIFHPETLEASGKAFQALMNHLKIVDMEFSTVLMVQVENETGLLGDSRDACGAANQKFAEAVPRNLIIFLVDTWDLLHPDLQEIISPAFRHLEGKYREGSWEQVFGKGPRTDELFMVYHYALHFNKIAIIGKFCYAIPLYTNTWMNYSGDNPDNAFPVVAGGGGMPGDYPSGGPVSNVLDIWQQFAPYLDFISPDIYLNDYESSCAKYRHRNQPLFIPEQRRDDYGARRIWIAYGSYAALGASPFGIDTVDPDDNAFTKHFGLLKSVSALVLEAQRRPGSSVGFCFDELPQNALVDPARPIVRHWGGFEITIEPCFVFGKRDTGAGMVIHRGGAKFLLIGWGFQVRAKSLSPKATFTGILSFEEKAVVNSETGELKTQRRLNGDETRSGKFAMMPSENPDYGGFPISVTVPARTMIAELEVYSLEEDDE